MSEAFFSGDAIVKVGAAGLDYSSGSLVAATSYITNFNVSGMETDTETINIFGNASIHKRSPKGEVEVAFDFIMRGDAGTLFERMVAGSSISTTTGTIDLSTQPQESVVYVQLLNEDGDTYKTYAFNNVLCTSYEGELGADDHATGSVTFKAPAKSEAGVTNVQVNVAGSATPTFSWA